MNVIKETLDIELQKDYEDYRGAVIEEYFQNTEIIKQLDENLQIKNNINAYTWYFYHEYSRSRATIDFKTLYRLKKLGVMLKSEIEIVKCYALDLIDNGYALVTVTDKIRILCSIINKTNNFDSSIIKGENEENLLPEVLREMLKQNVDIGCIRDYFLFLENNDILDEKNREACELLGELEVQRPQNVRTLPSNKDILSFEYYLKKFYKEETNMLMRNFFFPVLLWWKITNIIPMRPSEFTCKLSKDCLIQEEQDYYLLINRIKQSRIKNKRNKPKLPILSKIKITEEIYLLIKEYQKITEFDKDRKGLISHQAECMFSKQLLSQGIKVIQHKEDRYIDNYVIRDLNLLINCFYEVVIGQKYNYTEIKQRLLPGDTRHLAFCSLMLQGIPPIEIALLGGHTHLMAQNHYVGHAKYYIESEVLNYISSRATNQDISIQGLKAIIFSKSLEPPVALEKMTPTEDGVGYCTAELNDDIEICESDRTCIFCAKWWCLPNNHSYVKAEEYIERNCIQPIEQMLKNEEEILKKLLQENAMINICGLEELDKKQEELIKLKTMSIKSKADEIVNIRIKLLELNLHEQTIKNEDECERGRVIWLDPEQK